MTTPTPTTGYETTTAPAPSSGKGTAALVFGVLSIVFAVLFLPLGLLMGVVAVVLGVMGRKETAGRDGKATAGLVTGILGLAVALVVGVLIGSFVVKNSDTIRDCSQEPTQAAQEACIEQRMNQP